ncbi:hypothetical protein V8J82_18580 [Gymnodinialimonas sp. 2305UL16-5]|uniref:hypothetical protein n=1 Tax=Gymnodinialimonas mytili TaxID=3126503 RepID=UPI00309903F5
MAFDNFALTQDDEFEFNTTMSSGVFSVFEDALAARGIDAANLTAEQRQVFYDASDRIETVLDSDMESVSDAQTLLGEDVEVMSVDDLRTSDGVKLNGVATIDGKIVLDSALTGERLLETLVEELAEAAFYEALEDASQGDFGAEVEARIEGDASAAFLDQLATASEADTVQTAFGEGQANAAPFEADAQFFAEEVFSPQGVSVEAIKAQLDAWNGAQGYTNLSADGQVFFDPSSVQKVEGMQNLINTIRQAPANQKDAFGYEVRNLIPEPNRDLDGDGTISSTVAAFLIDPGPKAEVLGSPKNVKYAPIQGLSETFVANKGGSSAEWTARAGVEYKTEKKFEVANKNAVEISGTFGFGGSTAGLKESNERTTSQASTTSNATSFFEQVTKKYSVEGEKYAPGTAVSYGYHVATGDLKAIDTQKMLIILGEGESTGVVQDTAFLVDVNTTGTLKNVGLGVVATDVEQGLWL